MTYLTANQKKRLNAKSCAQVWIVLREVLTAIVGGRSWDGETIVDWGLWGIGLENYYAPTYSLCA
jgi:hypothetical protein